MDVRWELKNFLNSGLKRKFLFAFCLMIMGLGMLFFVKMVDDLLGAEDWVLLDVPVTKAVMQIRNPILNRVMLAITLMGNWQMVAVGTLLVGTLLLIHKKWHYFWGLIATDGVALVFIEWSKTLVSRNRPPTAEALIRQGGYSFPSGHSYFAGVFYGLLIYFWIRHLKSWRWRITGAIVGSIWILLLGLSRIYLGVHWLTDVAAGWAVSGAWLAATILIMEMENLFHQKEDKPVSKNFSRIITAFMVVWLMAWGWFYLSQGKIIAKNLGMKMTSPTNRAETAEIRTAPAARSRA